MHRSWLMAGVLLTTLLVVSGPLSAAGTPTRQATVPAESAVKTTDAPDETVTPSLPDQAHPADPAIDAFGSVSKMAGKPTKEQTADTTDKQIAFFQLRGEIPEVSSELSIFSGTSSLTLEKWLRKLAQARNDAKVTSLVLEIGLLQAGWAQIDELRSAIRRVSDAGKPVYGYVTDCELKNYVLASACDHVVIAPAGHLIIPGLHLQMWFYKDLMDKIGVTADILHIGPYKGAGEPYTRSGPSEELQAQYTSLTDSLYQQILQQIADSRRLTREQASALIDTALFSAKEAVEAGLVDQIMSREDLFAEIQKQQEAVVNQGYGQKSRQTHDLSNPFAFFKLFAQVAGNEGTTSKPAIGLILLNGMIVDKQEDSLFESGTVAPENIKDAVDAALEDDDIKAVVLRIDSPGGSALASDIMYGYIEQLADEKPVIVSMGNVAASGGYYVAAAAPVIMADPATITGSIGVLGGKVVISGLLEKVGIGTWSVSRGQMAGVFDMTAGFTPAERQKVFKLMNDIYGMFLERVLTTRKEKLTKPIDEIAGGRVYTGQQALDLGLVDQLGGLTEAVYLAADKAGLKSYEIRTIPKPKNFFESLFEDLFSGVDAEAQALTLHAGTIWPAGKDRASMAVRNIIGKALMRIRLLQNHSVLTVLPFDTNILP